MNGYTVRIKKSAEKELDSLPERIHKRIIASLLSLAENPRPNTVKKLRGREGYRIRVGDYRILYTVDDSHKTIEVYSAGHRKDIYR
ncbi:MAG TPA: type II toxin-antitoxin system RelE/ParE family toxin [bacterium]